MIYGGLQNSMGLSHGIVDRFLFMPTEIDPIAGSEIMELLSIDPSELEDPKRLYRIKEVTEFFHGNKETRWQILKLLSGFSGDRLDRVWTWVQIQGEYTRIIRSLNPEQFTEDIQKDLKDEFLTKKNLQMLHEQATTREAELRVQSHKIEAKRAEDEKVEDAEKKAVGEANDLSEIQEVKRNLEELEVLSNQMSQYA